MGVFAICKEGWTRVFCAHLFHHRVHHWATLPLSSGSGIINRRPTLRQLECSNAGPLEVFTERNVQHTPRIRLIRTLLLRGQLITRVFNMKPLAPPLYSRDSESPGISTNLTRSHLNRSRMFGSSICMVYHRPVGTPKTHHLVHHNRIILAPPSLEAEY